MLIVPTLHPAYLLRSGDDKSGQARFEQTVVDDFKKAWRLTKQAPVWNENCIFETVDAPLAAVSDPSATAPFAAPAAPPRFKNLFPTLEELFEFIGAIYVSGPSPLVTVDIETSMDSPVACELLCVGLGFTDASGVDRALCVPFISQGRRAYWTSQGHAYAWSWLQALLRDPRVRKNFHNGAFDTTALTCHGAPVLGWCHDCYVENETEFLTLRGWKPYAAVVEDDVLGTINAEGQLEWQRYEKRVRGRYVGDVFTFETHDTRCVVTPNHRMWVSRFSRRAAGGVGHQEPWGFVRADELYEKTPDYFFARTAPIPEPYRPEVADPVPGFFGNDFWAFVGLFIADGSRNGDTVQISQQKGGRAEPLLKRLSRNAAFVSKSECVHRETWRTKPCVEVQWRFRAPGLALWLNKNVGGKSPTRFLPPGWLELPRSQREALFAGLRAGDGVEKDRRGFYNSFSVKLVDDVQALALSLGHPATRLRDGESESVGFRFDECGATRKLRARERNSKKKGNIEKSYFDGQIVCFSVPNQTLITRSRGKPAFHGNTMVAHHVFDSELPHGLGYCGTRYLDVRYWKDDAKGDEKNFDVDDFTLRSYNLRDILVTHRLLPKFEREVSKLQLEPLYQEEIELNQIMTRATIRGLAVDSKRLADLTSALHAKKADGLGRLQAIAGGNIAPSKPAHLKYLLFDMLKFPVVLKTPSGNPATNKDALVLLALAAETDDQKNALAALVDFRTADKALSTWAEGLPILGDGRFHPTWKVLTTSGRFNSSPNAQNLPKSIQKIFRAAAPGCNAEHPLSAEWCYVGVDLSQAELRYIAYTANDPELLTMYAQAIDVHTVNCALLFGVRCPQDKEFEGNTNPQTDAFLVEAVPRLLGPKHDYNAFPFAPAKKWKAIRTLAKNFEFGTNYGASPETVFDVLRSKRDDSGKLLFADLDLALIEALLATKLRIRPALPKWWGEICMGTQKQGYFKCPVSGRVRWFRDGFKRNEMLNVPIQTGVASVMNQRLVKIQRCFDQETNGLCQVVLQVHDALTFECPKVYAPRAQQVIFEILNEPFSLPGHPNAKLPCDMPKIGSYVDEV